MSAFSESLFKVVVDTYGLPCKVTLWVNPSMGDGAIFKTVSLLSLQLSPRRWQPLCKFWCWHVIDHTRKYQWKVSDNVKCSYFFLKWSSNGWNVWNVKEMSCPAVTPEKAIVSPSFPANLSLIVNIQVCEMDQKLLIAWVMWGSWKPIPGNS